MKKQSLAWFIAWVWMMFASPSVNAQSENTVLHWLSKVKNTSYVYANTSTQLIDVLLDNPVNQMSLEQVKISILTVINEIRVKKWLQKVSIYDNNVEQIHSTYLFTSKGDESLWVEDHVDAKRRSFYERALDAKIPIDQNCRWDCRKSGENLASSSMTVKEIIEAWIHSPIHAANLYTASFDHIVIWYAPWWNNIVVGFLNIQ